MRHEGEIIGTKCFLVSKWTSFYAVEETIEAQDTEGRIDLDDPRIDRVKTSDLDLLRSRGLIGQNLCRNLEALSRDNGKEIESRDGDLEYEQSDSTHNDGDSHHDALLGVDFRRDATDDGVRYDSLISSDSQSTYKTLARAS